MEISILIKKDIKITIMWISVNIKYKLKQKSTQNFESTQIFKIIGLINRISFSLIREQWSRLLFKLND